MTASAMPRVAVRIGADDSALQTVLRRASKKLAAFSKMVVNLGARIGAMGAAIQAPFALAGSVYANFADQLSIVKAITGATDEQFARLTETAKRLGATTSFTASQIAAGMVELSRAGYHADQIVAAMPGTLALARAGALELTDAITIMADVSKAFGVGADQAERVGDVLVKAANSASMGVRDIGEAMKYAAATASMTGQSLDRVSAAIATMANRSIKGSQAGSSLSRVLIELADAGKQAFLKKNFDIDTTDAQGNLRDVLDILRDLDAATAGMGNAEKTSLFNDLFGTRGLQAAVSLSGNIAEWDSLTEAIRTSGGTAKSVAGEMDNNLGGAFRSLASAVESVQIALGEAVQGTLRGWMGNMTQAARIAASFVSAHRHLFVAALKVGAGLAAAGAGLIGFGVGLRVASALVGGLAAAIRLAIATLQGFGLFTTAVSLALKGLHAASLAVASGMNALKYVTLALTATQLGLSKAVAFTRATLVGATAWLKAAAVGFKAFSAGTAIAKGMVLGFAVTVKSAAMGVAAFTAALAGSPALIGALGAGIGVVVLSMVDLSGVGGRVVKFLKEKFAELLGFVKPVVLGIYNAISAGKWDVAADLAMSAVRTVFYSVADALIDKWHAFQDAVRSVFDTVKDVAGEASEYFKLAWENKLLVVEGLFWKLLDTASKVGWKIVGAVDWITSHMAQGMAWAGNKAGLFSDAATSRAMQNLQRGKDNAFGGRPESHNDFYQAKSKDFNQFNADFKKASAARQVIRDREREKEAEARKETRAQEKADLAARLAEEKKALAELTNTAAQIKVDLNTGTTLPEIENAINTMNHMARSGGVGGGPAMAGAAGIGALGAQNAANLKVLQAQLAATLGIRRSVDDIKRMQEEDGDAEPLGVV